MQQLMLNYGVNFVELCNLLSKCPVDDQAVVYAMNAIKKSDRTFIYYYNNINVFTYLEAIRGTSLKCAILLEFVAFTRGF